MAETGLSSFNVTVDTTNTLLHHIERAQGWPKEQRHQSYSALRATLHALRDRLTVEETAHLAAQLPLLVRGIYYDRWDPSRVPVKMDKDEFLARVGAEFPHQVDGGMEELAKNVLRALKAHISEGEWHNIGSVLPRDLQQLLPA
ncbi:Uncharacterized conserved protein, DUF2267 family [Streptomyces sp. DvalAA-14]|uniref:DUF2267 domain-containing protein n=1 Tax=unclassified Streptomyces TaxID=2593676 RepID=UPI00081B0649|nr:MULTISPECIES: DUF2267 domain-containing protein [unclassified Streptomyces]MYS22729.1 DUF2267 domain-containing protein [Streptomyces sp. SID4948]SCE21429.1 Uncharacterized conserved protein, DUF2267 family [Streptomyces sp. DvalAA-14]